MNYRYKNKKKNVSSSVLPTANFFIVIYWVIMDSLSALEAKVKAWSLNTETCLSMEGIWKLYWMI